VSRICSRFVVITIWSVYHSWLITGFVTRWVSIVVLEWLTLPEHLRSSSVFSGVCLVQSLVFCVVFCRSLFFLLAVALSALLPFVVSSYTFGIFNLYLLISRQKQNITVSKHLGK
jgi:branched-subunit amino acid transport protein